jgi:hypothetical protein
MLVSQQMGSFSDYITSWNIFYAALVGATAALMGLIFLAVSLRIELFNRKDIHEPRQIAWQTFLNFFWVFVIGITFLIPRTTALSLGIVLAVLGAVGNLVVIRRWWRARNHVSLKQGLIAFVPMLACYSAIIVSSLIGAFLTFPAFTVIAPVLIFIIGVAIYNAWELLFSYR